MTRIVPILCVVLALAIGVTAWSRLSTGTTIATPPAGGGAGNWTGPAAGDLAAALRDARRQCDLTPLDAVVARLEQAVLATPDDRDTWHLLAQACLERAQQRTHLRGMSVGEPVFATLPTELQRDLEQGLGASEKARELGDDSGDLFRIEAGLMSQQITGLATALQWNGKIGQALEQAAERARDNPYLHLALGARKLFAPRWLGHDPDGALEHFEFAAQAVDDERPAVFAAMASYLQQKRQQAIAWLEQAVARNPNNKFARVVLQRLRRGEDDPFGRDVTEAEIAAAK
jgi:tetratricopeptide (TPR) repeat protein